MLHTRDGCWAIGAANVADRIAARVGELRAGREAQAPVLGATDEDNETISGWTCPKHGNDDVRNLKSPKGREYRACGVPSCKEFQG